MHSTRGFSIGIAAVALAAAGAVHAQSGERRGPDADGNGIVTRAEATTGAEAQFIRMDRNGDGRLTMEDRPDRAHSDHAAPAGSEGGPEHGPGGHGPMMIARMADTNHDNAVDRAEFLAAATHRFDRVDADHDGSITTAERDAHRGQRQERRGDRPGQRGDHAMPPPPPPGE